MKITLMLPPFTQEELYGKLSGSNPILPPLDIAYMASYLEQKGHEVQLYDCFAESISFEKLKILLENDVPQLVIITVDFPTLSAPLISRAYQVARICKEIDPNIKIALYGYYPNKFSEQVLAKEEIDFTIIGEGEMVTADLSYALSNGCNFESIEGLGFKKDGQIVVNKQRPFIKDLDVLPLPAYHLLDIDQYKLCPTSRKKNRQMTILGSRGCPFGCYLCASPLFWNRKWRAHSPEYMVNNLEHLHKTYGITDFQFRDETFTVNRQRVIDFCSLLIDQGAKYVWSCYSTFDLIDEELIQVMKKAGCYQIDLGVETGSDKILKEYKKVSKDLVRKMMGIMKKIGMETRLFFIIGPPSKTKDDVEETIQFAIELDPDYVLFSPAVTFPGNELHDRMKKMGYQLPDFENRVYNSDDAVCDLPGFKREYIVKMVATAFRRFYMRPKYILKKSISIRSFYDIKSYWAGLLPLLTYIGEKKQFSHSEGVR